MNVYAVIDTNVLVSALYTKNSQSAIAQLIQALVDGEFNTLYNDDIIKEYREVLHRKKFNFDEELVEALVDAVIHHGSCADRMDSGVTLPDPDDVVFYEVALSKESAYLITGNTKHFPKCPIVVTPAEMMNILRTGGSDL